MHIPAIKEETLYIVSLFGIIINTNGIIKSNVYVDGYHSVVVVSLDAVRLSIQFLIRGPYKCTDGMHATNIIRHMNAARVLQ